MPWTLIGSQQRFPSLYLYAFPGRQNPEIGWCNDTLRGVMKAFRGFGGGREGGRGEKGVKKRRERREKSQANVVFLFLSLLLGPNLWCGLQGGSKRGNQYQYFCSLTSRTSVWSPERLFTHLSCSTPFFFLIPKAWTRVYFTNFLTLLSNCLFAYLFFFPFADN